MSCVPPTRTQCPALCHKDPNLTSGSSLPPAPACYSDLICAPLQCLGAGRRGPPGPSALSPVEVEARFALDPA